VIDNLVKDLILIQVNCAASHLSPKKRELALMEESKVHLLVGVLEIAHTDHRPSWRYDDQRLHSLVSQLMEEQHGEEAGHTIQAEEVHAVS
jgi:hypothetical protein